MCVGGFCGGGARGGRLAVAAYPTAVGPAQSACYNACNTLARHYKYCLSARRGPAGADAGQTSHERRRRQYDIRGRHRGRHRGHQGGDYAIPSKDQNEDQN